MTLDTLQAALEAQRDEYLASAEQAQVDYNEFHQGHSGRVAESARTAPMRWRARAEGIERALVLIAAARRDPEPGAARFDAAVQRAFADVDGVEVRTSFTASDLEPGGLAALLDGGPCFYCRHSDHEHHSSAVPRWCGECHCKAYAPTDDEYADGLVKLRAAALREGGRS